MDAELELPLATALETASTLLTVPASALAGTSASAAATAAATRMRMLREDMADLSWLGAVLIPRYDGIEICQARFRADAGSILKWAARRPFPRMRT